MKYKNWNIADIERCLSWPTDPLDWLSLYLPRGLNPAENISACLSYDQGKHKSVFLFLSACFLLTEKKQQEELNALIEAEEKFFPNSLGEPLEELCRYHWRIAAIPVTGNEEKDDVFYPLLCGYAKGETSCKIYIKKISDDSTEQLSKVNELLPGKKIFLSVETREATLTGDSLGLPVYLAIRSAIEGKNSDKIYATGRINNKDLIDSVGDIDRKLKLCDPNPLICPSNNEPSRKCIPLTDLDDAFAAYTDPENIELWRNVFSSTPAQILYDLENYPKNILDYIADSRHFKWNSLDCDKALKNLWRNIAGEKKKKDKIVDFICRADENKKLLPVSKEGTYYQKRFKYEKDLREGNTQGVKSFLNIDLPPEVEEDHNELFRLETGGLEGQFHNCFKFPKELIFSPAIQNDFDYFVSRGKKMKGLGDLYGIVGQNHAFRREYEKAMSCFDKAEENLTKPEDKLQTVSYRFFCEQDTFPCSPNAESLLWQLIYPVIPLENKSIIALLCTDSFLPTLLEKTNSFVSDRFLLLAICRFLVELPPEQLAQINITPFLTVSLEQKKHPWQLIYYNLGKICLLRHYAAKGKQFLEQSKSLCAEKDNSNAIRIMELLPLSLLCRDSISKEDSDEVLLLRDAALDMSPEHFAVLKDAQTAEEILSLVRIHLKRLFSFNYR